MSVMSRDEVESVLTRMFEGEPLTRILPGGRQCREFFAALEDGSELATAYAAARDAQAERMASDILTIADSDTDPRDRDVKIKARQWLAAKYKPRTFGERLEVHQTGQIDLRAALALADARVAQMTPRRDHDVTPRLEEPLAEPIEADWSPAREADAPPLVPSPGADTALTPSVE